MNISRPLSLLVILLAASCASHSGSNSSTGEAQKTLSQRLNESNGYKQDANGNWVPKIDKRSSFESQGDTHNFKGKFSGKTYKAGEYAKKSWWGNKDYGRQPYAGNTDGSRFQQESLLGGKSANESGTAAPTSDPYQTGNYATSAAREASGRRLAKPSDAATYSPRNVNQEPEIIDWQQQRGITLDQSRGILGR